MWYQKTLTLSAKSRGFHLVTDEILNQLADMPRVNIGLTAIPPYATTWSVFSSAPFPTTEIMSMTMREQTICLLISNPQCWEHRLYCRYIKGVFRPAPGKASGWGNIASTADRVASSRHYKGSKK